MPCLFTALPDCGDERVARGFDLGELLRASLHGAKPANGVDLPPLTRVLPQQTETMVCSGMQAASYTLCLPTIIGSYTRCDQT